MDRDRIRLPLLIGAVVVGLLLGLALGGGGLLDRILGGPDPKVIATSSLESMRAAMLASSRCASECRA